MGKRTSKVRIARSADIRDWRVALGIGMLIGMLIVGLPQLLGVALLLSLLTVVMQLVAKERI